MKSPFVFPWKWIAIPAVTLNVALVWAWVRPVAPAQPEPVRSDLTPYAALGSFVAENNHIAELQWTSDQFGAFQRGFAAVYEKNGYKMDAAAQRLRSEVEQRVRQMTGPEEDPVEAYFAEIRAKEGVSKAESGLHFRIIDAGFGEPPSAESTVVASLSARLPDGTKLPALSQVRLRAPLSSFLPGLSEGAQRLRPGGKALLYLPGNLSFGQGAWPQNIAPGTPIIFLFELHEIVP